MFRWRENVWPGFVGGDVAKCVTSSSFPGLLGQRGGCISVAIVRLEFDKGVAILKSCFCIVFNSPEAFQEARVWRRLLHFAVYCRRAVGRRETATIFLCPTD